MRKEEGEHRQQHDTKHSQRHWTQHTQHPRGCFAGGQRLAQRNAWGHARSRRVLQPTNGSSRKVSANSWAAAVWSKSIRGPWTGSLMPHEWIRYEYPLIGVSPQMRMRRWRWTSAVPSCGHTTTTCTIPTPTHTRMYSLLSEWAATGAWWIFPID